MADGSELGRDEFKAVVEGFWPGEIEWDIPLSELTTLKIGGPARAVIRPASTAEAECVVRGCQNARLLWVCIGKGSNILALDEGFPGVVIALGRMSGIRYLGRETSGPQQVEVESGCSLAALLKWCADQSLSGLEFAAGIPGSVGGAVFMNAGAWGTEMKDVIRSITWFDGEEIVTRERADLEFGYRCWKVREPVVVLKIVISLEDGDRKTISKRCREYVAERKGKQPYGAASAGSFFKNPEGVAAGRLIQNAGLKGARIGGAVVSDMHANFLVNAGGATAEDVLSLMQKVQEQVKAGSGIMLEPEVHFLGKRGLRR